MQGWAMRKIKNLRRIYVFCVFFLCGVPALYANGMYTEPPEVYANAMQSDGTKENINALSALEFELKTTLYGRGYQFDHLRRVLGGFETVEQIIYLMRVSEGIAERMRANFICIPIAGISWTIFDETEDIDELPEFNLANLDAAQLEELPYLNSLLAGRIARASRKGLLTERWKLLTVEGITPEIYAAIRRYFTLYEPRPQSKSSFNHEVGFRMNSDTWKLRNTLRASTGGGVTFAIRTLHDNTEDVFSPRGWYASGDSFPGLARRMGMYAQFGGQNLSVLLGNFRVRTLLGLAAGRSGYGGEMFSHLGSKSAAILPQLSDSARDVFTGAALSFALPGLSLQTFFSARSYFASPDKLHDNIYQGTLRSLIYKQENLREGDTAIINEFILGTLARLDVNKVSISAAGFFPFYSCAFDANQATDFMSGDRRWHGAFGFSWNEEDLSFFGEYALAGDTGYGGSGDIRARALGLGMRGKRARFRYSLSYQESTQILPGLHDGLAGLARAGRIIELQNEWLIFDFLRWQYAVNFYPEAQADAKSRFNTTLRWKSSNMFEILLSARLVHENNEQASAQYRGTFIWSSSSLFSLKVDCGTRIEKGRGSWLTTAFLVPIAGVRYTLAYGAWQADPKLHLWPSFPILISAGENSLTSYSGKGRMVIFKAEMPLIWEKIRPAFKASFKDGMKIDELFPFKEFSFAASLQYRM
jgi:hypothetical protein